MAAKLKGNPSKSLFGDDDFLDLFDDEKPKTVRGKATRGGPLSRSSATDNIFSMLAEEVKRDGGDNEDSDVSAADPDDILKNMKDMDDMDADLFTSKKKPGTAPAQTKQRGNEGPKRDSSTLETNGKPQGAAGESIAGGKKPNSAPATTAQNNRKFTLSDSGGDDGEVLAQRLPTKDVDDPLADLLDDLLPDETKPQSKSSTQPAKTDQKPAPSPTASPFKAANKRGNLTFDDDKDDLMDALGLKSDESQNRRNVLWSNKERSEPPQRARTKLDEILEKKERKEQPQQPREKASAVKEPLVEDDLTFGSYQPTLVSTPEGRQSRRQSVRFSTEDVSASTPEKKAKAITPAMPAPLRHRNSADWLGLKTDEDQGFLEDHAKDTKASTDSPKAPSSPALERRSSVSRATSGAKLTTEIPALTDNLPKQSTAEVTKSLKREEEEDDWFAALSRKKAMSDSLGLREEVDLDSPVSKQVPSQAHAVKEDMVPSVKETSDTFIGQPSPTAHSTPVRERRTKQDNPAQASDPSSTASVSQPQLFPSDKGSRVPHHEPSRAPEETLQQLPSCLLPTATPPGTLWAVPLQNQIPNTPAAVQQQVTFSSDTLQQLLLQQQVMQSHLLGGVMDAGVLHRLKEREQPSGDNHALQSRIIQLEGQVQALQLEREKSQLLLENQQQLHKKDLELMENAYKARVKMLEESSAQRETQARQENEDLMERLSTAMQSAEQERSEMLAHNQRKLTQAQQDRDREVDRLRDLQRKSILEMKKDHEHQVQRLKKLKDEEIDAVTSATSQTRSLTVVMEQMEQFSSRLGEISSRVESTHEHTAHGLEQGARHRDEQHRLMQERVAQQQKAMVEERAYLKEIISRMDTQLNEQQRQLEKERWKMTAEQAKAESTQRGLEDERRALNLQINMEREELERAKSALLEEQKCVMQHCAEERRKLAAELAHFHALEKQRHERAERDASSLLEKREGSIISLAQEQADLKLHTAELKRKEMAAAQERETLGRQREELDREKERISSTALRLQTRAQEVEAFSRLAAEKYEEGERALQEAKHVEAEHEARLRKIHTQTERLRQQEQLMLQQRMGLSHLQKETEELRLDPPITFDPQIIQPILPGSGLPNPQLPLSLSIPHSTSFANSQAMALQASLALWKYTADKDREYLQEEQIFLDNLKRKSSRSTFNTD